MILVKDAGSIRVVAACDAITCPLVSSNNSQAFADNTGSGIGCASALDRHAVATSRLAANFFINIGVLGIHAFVFRDAIGTRDARMVQ